MYYITNIKTLFYNVTLHYKYKILGKAKNVLVLQLCLLILSVHTIQIAF